jgi:hypothetical protein
VRHARPDYDRIQDPEGKIPADEPVFLLRAQDGYAHFLVEQWARQVLNGSGDPRIAKLAFEQAQRMKDWPVKKTPDLPPRLPGEPRFIAVHGYVIDVDTRKPIVGLSDHEEGDRIILEALNEWQLRRTPNAVPLERRATPRADTSGAPDFSEIPPGVGGA